MREEDDNDLKLTTHLSPSAEVKNGSVVPPLTYTSPGRTA
jgi:hypothetical protein